MQSMSSTRNEMIIDELQKQYNVVQVDPTNPITEQYDVLLAVQPSSLGPQQMETFHRGGQSRPADGDFRRPFPAMARDVAGTTAPSNRPGGMNPSWAGSRPAAQGRHRPAVGDAGGRFRRPRRRLAGLQPLSAIPRTPAPRNGFSSKKGSMSELQPTGSRSHRSIAAVAAAVPGLVHRPELLALEVLAAGHRSRGIPASCRPTTSWSGRFWAADEPEPGAVRKADRRQVHHGGPHHRQAQARQPDVGQRAGRRRRG